MSAGLVVMSGMVSDNLADNDFENDFLGEEEGDFILFSAASTFAKRDLNRMQGLLSERANDSHAHSLYEFKANFRTLLKLGVLQSYCKNSNNSGDEKKKLPQA